MAQLLYNGTVSTSAYSANKGYVISNAYTFRLEVIEDSTSTDTNSSSITTNVYIKASSSSWSFSYGSDDIKATVKRTNPSGTVNNIIDKVYKKHTGTSSEVRIATKTENVVHKSDGSGTVSYDFHYEGAAKGNVSSGLPKSCSLSSGTLYLTSIPRSVSISASPSSVGKNDTLSISVPASDLYTTVTIKLGSTTKTVWYNAKGAKSQSIDYNTLRSSTYFGASAHGNMVITCSTMTTSGGSVIGTSSVTISLLDSTTGGTTVPISLYHGLDGTGVSIGYEATGPGFFVDGEKFAPITVTINGTNYRILGRIL